MAIKVLDLDLFRGPQPLTGLLPYGKVLALIRWRGRPLGQIYLTANGDHIDAMDVWQAASVALGSTLAMAVLEDCWLPPAAGVDRSTLPSATIVICTRNRPDDLNNCLEALMAVDLDGAEVIVVDNAPSDDQTQQLVTNYPVRYVVEPRRGLNWARTRGAAEATSEIVIYTDDDVVVEHDWVNAMRRPFADAAVSAVTGLVMPYELETAAQEFFERNTHFGRGFARRVFSLNSLPPAAAANVGAGASMAFRRGVLNRLGLFAVELDGGTAARSGGDTYAFYRLLSLGHQLVYTPEALVWHRHRRTEAELRSTLYGYSVGTVAFWLRCLLEHGEFEVLPALAWWLWHHHWRNLLSSLRRQPDSYPLGLALAEWRGCLAAPYAYLVTRQQERRALPAGGRPG